MEVLEKKVDQLMSQLAALTRQIGQTSPDTSNTLTTDSGPSRDAALDSTDIAAMLEIGRAHV